MEKYCPECGAVYFEEQDRCDRDGRRLMVVVSDDLWVGRELDGRYHVLRVLGKGGMGTVFEVEQTLLGRRLALKLLRRELGQDKASVMRFFAEAKAMSSLRNAHTITLHDFGATDEGQLFYTMDLLEGQGLHELMRETGPMPFARACAILLQVLESLEEAHDRNILHRDLKPENIFVARARGRDFAVVLDFGIAKLVGDSSLESVTRTGLICGTPAYMSPEQALGSPAVKASDLYSLGVVLYEMLAGRLPFDSGNALRMAMSHISEEPPPLSAMEGLNVPEPLDRFLGRALRKDANERLATVAEFRAELLGALMQCPRPMESGVGGSSGGGTYSESSPEAFALGGVFGPSSSDWSASSWTGVSGELTGPVTSGPLTSPTRRFPWLPVLASLAFVAVAAAAVVWVADTYYGSTSSPSQASSVASSPLPGEDSSFREGASAGSPSEFSAPTGSGPGVSPSPRALSTPGTTAKESDAPGQGGGQPYKASTDETRGSGGGVRGTGADARALLVTEALRGTLADVGWAWSGVRRGWTLVWGPSRRAHAPPPQGGASKAVRPGRLATEVADSGTGGPGSGSGASKAGGVTAAQPNHVSPDGAGGQKGNPSQPDDGDELDFRPVVVPAEPKIPPGASNFDSPQNPSTSSEWLK